MSRADCDQIDKNVCRRQSVGRRPMVVDQIDLVMFGDGLELVVQNIGQQPAAQLNCAQTRIGEPIFPEGAPIS